jgi:parvulin-like peptidyl-prolyl isomerase
MRAISPQLRLVCLLTLALGACQSNPTASTQPAAGVRQPDLGPVAYVNGQPVTWSQIQTPLIEAGGGQVLVELVMDRSLEQRLAERSLRVSEQDIQAEERLLGETLSRDADQASRLLRELRNRRGLGDWRYAKLLWRNAAMRMLVQPEVVVNDATLQQAYEIRYGARYEARLIVANQAGEANAIVRRARDGAVFSDLAVQHSIDSSKANGGRIDPINPADPSWPEGVRDAIVKLQPGEVSDPILMDNGYAILRLERKIDAQAVRFDDVRDQLARHARRDVEQGLMQRLARTTVAESNVTVLDPALSKSWAAQRRNTVSVGQ